MTVYYINGEKSIEEQDNGNLNNDDISLLSNDSTTPYGSTSSPISSTTSKSTNITEQPITPSPQNIVTINVIDYNENDYVKIYNYNTKLNPNKQQLTNYKNEIYAPYGFSLKNCTHSYINNIIYSDYCPNTKFADYMFANLNMKGKNLVDNYKLANYYLVSAKGMFENSYFNNINLSFSNTYNLEDVSYMFNNVNLDSKDIILSYLNTYNVTNFSYMFANLKYNIDYIYMNDLSMNNAIYYKGMFYNSYVKYVYCSSDIYNFMLEHKDELAINSYMQNTTNYYISDLNNKKYVGLTNYIIDDKTNIESKFIKIETESLWNSKLRKRLDNEGSIVWLDYNKENPSLYFNGIYLSKSNKINLGTFDFGYNTYENIINYIDFNKLNTNNEYLFKSTQSDKTLGTLKINKVDNLIYVNINIIYINNNDTYNIIGYGLSTNIKWTRY